MVQETIAPPLAKLTAAGLEIGYCARPGEVDVRLTARGPRAEAQVGEAEAVVRGLVGKQLFGVAGESLEQVVVRLLTERQQTLAVAESCTGGRLADRVTDVPGASAVFVGGVVTYSNELKQRLLGVRADTLTTQGAVSETTAREMAEGARTRLGADFALATTGIAGPSGGTKTKPVGTVFIALATPNRTVVLPQLNRFDRDTFKNVTTQQALELLRRELL
jgi:nicotinamide-nucleotide amidase